ADATRLLASQKPAALEEDGIRRVGGRGRRRQLRNVLGEGTEIVVGESLGRLVHRRAVAPSLPKEEELSHHEERRLPANRRRVGKNRVPCGSGASAANLHSLLERRAKSRSVLGEEKDRREGRKHGRGRTARPWPQRLPQCL